MSVGVKPSIRQLFPTVAASLDDSDITAEASKIREEAQQILSGHSRSRSFASNIARFYA